MMKEEEDGGWSGGTGGGWGDGEGWRPLWPENIG